MIRDEKQANIVMGGLERKARLPLNVPAIHVLH
jgi:hypothetical protein